MRKQYSELGRRLLIAAAAKSKVTYSDEQLRGVIGQLGRKTVDDAVVAVGRGELSAADAIKAMFPGVELQPVAAAARPKNRYAQAPTEEGWFALAKGLGMKFRLPGARQTAVATAGSDAAPSSIGVPIRGMRNDIPVTMEDGGAVPGDRVVGVLESNGGIRVFQIHSPHLKDYESARWIDVTWDVDPDKPERFPARISVTVVNEPGTLAEVATVIAEAGGNIDNLRMLRRAADFTEMLIELEVFDIAHLNTILAGLRAKAVVSAADRVFG